MPPRRTHTDDDWSTGDNFDRSDDRFGRYYTNDKEENNSSSDYRHVTNDNRQGSTDIDW